MAGRTKSNKVPKVTRRYNTRSGDGSLYFRPNRGGLSLLSLPDELLLEVVNACPRPSLHTNRTIPYEEKYLLRHRSITAFSQTCRRLRNIFLPYVWRSIEAFASRFQVDDPNLPNALTVPDNRLWKKELAVDLVRQLEIVTVRVPSLASHVQTMIVYLTDYSGQGVCAELVRALRLLSNLHTLHIVNVPFCRRPPGGALTVRLKYGAPLLSVRHLAIPWMLCTLLESVPNVQSVHFIDGGRGHWDFYIPQVLPFLRSASGLKEFASTGLAISYHRFPGIAKSLGNVERMSIALSLFEVKKDTPSLEDCITRGVSRLKKLRFLEIIADIQPEGETIWRNCAEDIVPRLNDVVRKRSVDDKKSLEDEDGIPALHLTFVLPSRDKAVLEFAKG